MSVDQVVHEWMEEQYENMLRVLATCTPVLVADDLPLSVDGCICTQYHLHGHRWEVRDIEGSEVAHQQDQHQYWQSRCRDLGGVWIVEAWMLVSLVEEWIFNLLPLYLIEYTNDI